MLLAYLACAPLAWGTAVVMIGLGDNPSNPHTGADLDAAFRTATGVAILITLVGAVVSLIPLTRRTLRIHTNWRAILILDGAVGAGTLVGFGFAVALG